ncbi:hypothetical protein OPQ81_001403 [Rhizoctonia solani]|nr:hypothetical protein OPQ81_001403 [Rhizoctonia solani]
MLYLVFLEVCKDRHFSAPIVQSERANIDRVNMESAARMKKKALGTVRVAINGIQKDLQKVTCSTDLQMRLVGLQRNGTSIRKRQLY